MINSSIGGSSLIILGAMMVAPGWAGLVNEKPALVLGLIGTAFIVLGTWIQYKSSLPFEREYLQSDWIAGDHGAVIVLKPADHGKGAKAQGEIYAKNEDGEFYACMAGVNHKNGTVTFSSSGVGFDCKVVVR